MVSHAHHVLAPFVAAITFLSLLWPCAGLNATDNGPVYFEVDVVLPRNETYKSSDTFPIVLALQNYTSLAATGNFSFSWDIMPYSWGVSPGGILYDVGYFDLRKRINTTSGATIVVGNSNVTSWIRRKEYGEQYMLQWVVEYPELRGQCGTWYTSYISGDLMFSVLSPSEEDWNIRYNITSNATTPDILQVPECPAFGSVGEIQQDPTNASCPILSEISVSPSATPCAVVVDADVKSAISTQVAILARPPTTTSSSATPSKTNAAVANYRPPAGAGLAAMCIMYGLAY